MRRAFSTPPSVETLQSLARTASRLLDMPMAAVTIMTNTQVVTLAGRDFHRTVPRGEAPCYHVLTNNDLFVVENLSKDPGTQASRLVTDDPHARSYAGVPIRSSDGTPLASLCVIHDEPLEFTAEQEEALRDLGQVASAIFGG